MGYVIGELDSYVTVVRVDRQTGSLEPIQRVSALPDDWSGVSWAADIHLSPDGRYLYVSNRGHDSIAVFAVDREEGTLTPVQHMATGGKTPRNFSLSPDGGWLLAANQESDTVCVFRRDAETGRLAETSSVLHVAAPVCIQFALS